jgi:GNAT superfamily N-acetyltransferase
MWLIRQATADDAVRIRPIARAAFVKYAPRIGGRDPSPMSADFAAAIALGQVVVIEAAGSIGGYMIAGPQADAYFIDAVAVDPALQGQGLGRKLIEHAASEAKRHGLPALRLYTNVVMTENLSMYAHMGFVETHRVVEHGFHRVYLRRTLC